MASDGEIIIETGIDASGITKGISEINKSLKDIDSSFDKYTEKSEAAAEAVVRFADSESKAAKSTADFAASTEKAAAKGNRFLQFLGNIKKSVKSFLKDLSQGKASITDMANAFGAVGKIAGTAGAAIKKCADFMNESAALYRVQASAENALAQAARNNPYLNGESVAALKQFASQLQSTSEVGDETSIQLMTRLAAAGRTQEEITNIMSAAVDIAASGAMSMESAVNNLNRTFAGLAGELGESVPAIKALTREELQNGKAVEIMAAQYKGMAQATADVEVQLSNAWGDFKENLGHGWQEVTAPVKEFFLDVLDKVNTITAHANSLKDAKKNDKKGTADTEDYALLLKEKTAALQLASAQLNELADTPVERRLHTYDQELAYKRKRVAALAVEENELRRKLNAARDAEETEKKLKEETRLANERAAAEADIADYIKKNIEAREKQLELLRTKAAAEGQDVKQADIENIYLNSYIDLIGKANDKIIEAGKTSAEWRKEMAKRPKEIEKLVQAAKDEANAESKMQKAIQLTNELMNSFNELNIEPKAHDRIKDKLHELSEIEDRLKAKNKDGSFKISDATIREGQNPGEERSREQLLAGIQAAKIKAAKEAAKELSQIEDNFYVKSKKRADELAAFKAELKAQEIEQHIDLSKEIEKIAMAMMKNRIEAVQHVMQEVQTLVQQSAQFANELSAMMTQTATDRETAELAALEEKYQQGGMMEQEYAEKRKAIQKKAANDAYKYAVFEWMTKIAVATASSALGVVNALNEGDPYTKIPRAIMAGTLGALQVAAILAAKPKPPAFATGGVVPGTRGTGDSVHALLTPHELVLNDAQQTRLMNIANGVIKGEGMRVTVNNSQGDRVQARPHRDRNGLTIDILDAHINKGFSDGTYDAGYSGMQVRQRGVQYL